MRGARQGDTGDQQHEPGAPSPLARAEPRLPIPRLRAATNSPRATSQAQEKYNEAQMTGKALLIVVPKEHAEGYVEILIRSDPMIYAEIEEDA